MLFGTTETFLKRFELESLDALPNHKELLDRIRVIHSEGDSLYREFTIPEEGEENLENIPESTEVVTSEDTVINPEANTETVEDKQLTTMENAEIEAPASQSKAKRSYRKADESVAQLAEGAEVKVSWRDKMKARMAENADNYENLDSVLEKKNKK